MAKSPKHIVQAITQRQIMSYLALFFSVIGSAVFSAMAMYIVWVLWKGGWSPVTQIARIEILGKTLEMALFGSLTVVASFGFLMGMRTIKLGPTGVLMSSDEDHMKNIDDNVQAIADSADAIVQADPVASEKLAEKADDKPAAPVTDDSKEVSSSEDDSKDADEKDDDKK